MIKKMMILLIFNTTLTYICVNIDISVFIMIYWIIKLHKRSFTDDTA